MIHVSNRTVRNSQPLCSFTYSVLRLSSLAQQCKAVGLLQRVHRFSVCISFNLLMTLRMFSCEMVLQSSESTGFMLDRQDIPSEIVSEWHCNRSCMEVISWRMTTFSITSQDVTSGRISSLAAMSCNSRLFSAAPRYRNYWRVVFCTSQIP